MNEHASSERSIFEAAIALGTPHERAAYLDGACGGDGALRREVEALLAAHDRLGGLPTSPAGGAAAGERPGAEVGPYRLLGPLGEGGFGMVYLAEQQRPVRRRVALKLVKPGM